MTTPFTRDSLINMRLYQSSMVLITVQSAFYIYESTTIQSSNSGIFNNPTQWFIAA